MEPCANAYPGKWLETISLTPHDLSPSERHILSQVRGMLDETEFAVPFPPSSASSGADSSDSSSNNLSTSTTHNGNNSNSNNSNSASSLSTSPEAEGQRIRALGAAVVRLWAETFRGTQIFDIVRAMGRSLEIYGEVVERGVGVLGVGG